MDRREECRKWNMPRESSPAGGFSRNGQIVPQAATMPNSVDLEDMDLGKLIDH